MAANPYEELGSTKFWRSGVTDDPVPPNQLFQPKWKLRPDWGGEEITPETAGTRRGTHGNRAYGEETINIFLSELSETTGSLS